MEPYLFLLKKVLCFFGYHNWLRWYEPKHKVEMRKCINCQKTQFLYEEPFWKTANGEKPYKEWVDWSAHKILK